MKRWLALGSGLLVLLASLASCDTFDRRAVDQVPSEFPPGFAGAPVTPLPSVAGSGAGFPGFGPAGKGGAPFFGAGSGGFAAVGAAGSGGGGWQLLDGGTPPPTPATDDSGADDAGR